MPLDRRTLPLAGAAGGPPIRGAPLRRGVVAADRNDAYARHAGHAVVPENGRFAACGSAAKLTDDLVHRHLAV